MNQKLMLNYKILIYLIPILDIGTGLVLFLIGLPPEQIRSNLIVFILPMMVRLIILLLSVKFIVKNYKKIDRYKIFKIFLFFIFIVIIIECFSFFEYQNISKYILSIVNLSKIIFYPLVFIYFLNKLDFKFSMKWLYIISFISPLAIILGLFGIGFTQYGGIATIGVWPYGSGNALSSIMFIISTFIFYNYAITNKFYYLLLGFTVIFAISLTGSKMGILSSTLSFLLMIGIFKKKDMYYFLFMLIFGILFLFFVINYLDKLIAIGRMISQLNNYNMLHLIFGGREDRIPIAIELFKSYNIFEILFGTGYYMPNYAVIHNFGINPFDNMELDFLDILVKYGFTGILIIYGWWLYLLSNSFTSKIKNKKMKFINFYVVLTLLFQSTVAGHVIFAGLSAIYILIFLIFIRKYNEKLFIE